MTDEGGPGRMGGIDHVFPSFTVPVAVLHVECSKCPVPDLREGRPMCKERNESEDPEKELILPREAWLRRQYANKAFREMSPLAGLPRDTPSCLHKCTLFG